MKKVNVLIAYDIASPKRLGRVHRTLTKVALPVQYSIFLTRLSRKSLFGLCTELAQLIDTNEDDLRIYEIPDNIDVDLLGRQFMPEGFTLGIDDLGKMLDRGSESV